MVKVKEPSDYERLEIMITTLCQKHKLKLFVNGWTRKTFDVFLEHQAPHRLEHFARIESLATSNGEIQIFDDRANAFAQDLGEELEKAFGLAEATIVRTKGPFAPR